MDLWYDLVLAVAGLAILGCVISLVFIVYQNHSHPCGQRHSKAAVTQAKSKTAPKKLPPPKKVTVNASGKVAVANGPPTKTYVGPTKEFWMFIIIWMTLEVVMRYRDQQLRK